jgi:hypothetical protein
VIDLAGGKSARGNETAAAMVTREVMTSPGAGEP